MLRTGRSTVLCFHTTLGTEKVHTLVSGLQTRNKYKERKKLLFTLWLYKRTDWGIMSCDLYKDFFGLYIGYWIRKNSQIFARRFWFIFSLPWMWMQHCAYVCWFKVWMPGVTTLISSILRSETSLYYPPLHGVDADRRVTRIPDLKCSRRTFSVNVPGTSRVLRSVSTR